MTKYLSIEYTDGRIYSQIVYDITPDKIETLKGHRGVKEVRVIGNTR